MGESTLTIPAGSVDYARSAALHEAEADAAWVAAALAEAGTNPTARGVEAAQASLAETRTLAAQLLTAPDDHEIELRGEASGLAHLAETMARKVLAPQLSDVVEISPMEGEEAAELMALTDALSWASGQAARLHGRS